MFKALDIPCIRYFIRFLKDRGYPIDVDICKRLFNPARIPLDMLYTTYVFLIKMDNIKMDNNTYGDIFNDILESKDKVAWFSYLKDNIHDILNGERSKIFDNGVEICIDCQIEDFDVYINHYSEKLRMINEILERYKKSI